MTPDRSAPESGFSAFLPRLGTAAVYGALALGSLWWGAIPAAVLYGLMGGFATHEFYVFRRVGVASPQVMVGVAGAGAMPVAAALWGYDGIWWVATVVAGALIVRHTIVMRVRTADTAEALFGSVYVGVLMSHLVLVRRMDAGLVLAVTLLVSVWASDVAAYSLGTAFGRHRLAPKISPKKSWEGFYAGLVACVGVWVSSAALFDTGISLTIAGLVGLAVGLASVVGDLFESRLKREMGVKDSGTALPGHGGFLDRVDSLLLACLIGYWALVIGGAG